jgi:sec-independent protein translocase protein TatC
MSDSDPEFATESDDSGARKSFWEHLGDLRKALIRSAIAIGIAFTICLVLYQQTAQILEYPLHRMHMFEKPVPTVTLEFGATKLGPYTVSRDDFPLLPPGDAPHAVYRVGTKQIGNDQVFTLNFDAAASAAAPEGVRLNTFGPAESFMVAFQIAIYAALVVSSPFWLYFVGSFIVPAFKAKERQVVFLWVFWGGFLALSGVLLTYFLLLPLALRAAVKYSDLLGFNSSDWQAAQYITFTVKFILGMALGFQFPLIVLLLVKMGLVTAKQLAHYRRHVIVLVLILGAVLTTPEPITQIAMAVPLYLLYEICIWIAWYWDRQKRKRGEFVDV